MFSPDALLNKLSPQPLDDADKDFNATRSVTNRYKLDFPSASEMAVVIPSWHGNSKVLSYVAQNQYRKGRSVLSYLFHDDVLTADPELTVECFSNIADNIAADVTTAQEIGIKKFRFIAFSLGCAIVLYAAGERKLAGHFTLVCPGGSLATSLWTGIRTQHLREKFEAKGINRENLEIRWQKLAPSYQAIHNIRNSSADIYYSQADKVIMPDTLPPLINAMSLNGNSLKVHKNHYLGHYGTILCHSLFTKNL